MRRFVVSTVITVAALGVSRPACADATAFIGTASNPSNRLAKGFSAGSSLIIIGFEFEYASVSKDEVTLAPSLRTWMGNVLLQTPDVGTFQLYATAGGGLYREELVTNATTSFGVNTGGGVKIPLVGPLRLRLDYRFFKLHGSPLYSQSQRFYAGVNLKF